MREQITIAGNTLAQSTLCVSSPRIWSSIITELTSQVHRADMWIPGELETSITIAQVRDMQRFAHATAVGQCKIICIPMGDELRVEVANALLKLLEEPPPATFLVVLSETDQVLATVKSRLRVIFIQGSLQAEATTRQKMAQVIDSSPVKQAHTLLYFSSLMHSGIQQDIIEEAYSNLSE